MSRNDLEPHDLVVWLHAQIDRDDRYGVSTRDRREVWLKRTLVNRCAEYLEVEDDPAYDIALDILRIISELYGEGDT